MRIPEKGWSGQKWPLNVTSKKVRFLFPFTIATLGKVHNPFFKLYRHYIHTSILFLFFFSIFSLSLYFLFPANKLNLDKDLQPETSCLPTKLTLTLHENSFWLFEEFVFIRKRLQASRCLLDIYCYETEMNCNSKNENLRFSEWSIFFACWLCFRGS